MFIRKVQCFFCKEKIQKENDEYNVTLDTAEGPHMVKSCPKCAKDLNEVLKEIEEIKYGER